MSLISLDLNQVRQTSGIFSSSGNTLDDVCGQLRRQWSALSSTWEGDSKYDVAGEVHAVLNRGRQSAEYTRERGVKLTQIADRFQAADENEPLTVEKITWQTLTPLAGLVASGPAVLGAQTEVVLASLPVTGQHLTVADYDQLLAGYDAQLSDKQDRLQRVVPTSMANYRDILASDEQFLAETNGQLTGGNWALNFLAGTVPLYQKIQADTQSRMERTRQKIAELEDEQSHLPGQIDEIKKQQQLAIDGRQVEQVKSTMALSQHNPDWKDTAMGPNGTIGQYGCFITTLAMICRANGIDTNPLKVNEWMQQNGGYQSGTSNMYTAKQTEFLRDQLKQPDLQRQSIPAKFDSLKKELAGGQPVVVHIPSSTSDGHWVLATGVDEQGNVQYVDSGNGKSATFKSNQPFSGLYVFKPAHST